MYSTTVLLNSALDELSVIKATPRPLYSQEREQVPIVREDGWFLGPVRKISPPPGLDPRTVQPVASRYTDWAVSAPRVIEIALITQKTSQ
jgi:hypothetical protein